MEGPRPKNIVQGSMKQGLRKVLAESGIKQDAIRT